MYLHTWHRKNKAILVRGFSASHILYTALCTSTYLSEASRQQLSTARRLLNNKEEGTSAKFDPSSLNLSHPCDQRTYPAAQMGI